MGEKKAEGRKQVVIYCLLRPAYCLLGLVGHIPLLSFAFFGVDRVLEIV